MDTEAIEALVEQLGDDVGTLEGALKPLLKSNTTEVASKLALLDRAKLYILITYAIEAILFSYLRLNGANAKEHAVFRELTRVKQYFEKLKLAEYGPEKPNMRLDKGAAGRFIKHALAERSQSSGNAGDAAGKESAISSISGAAPNRKRRFDEVDQQDQSPAVSKDIQATSEDSSDDSSDESSDSEADGVSSEKVTGDEKAAQSVAPAVAPDSVRATATETSNQPQKKGVHKSKRGKGRKSSTTNAEVNAQPGPAKKKRKKKKGKKAKKMGTAS